MAKRAESFKGILRAPPSKHKLTRVTFTVSRLMEFCTLRELQNQTGHVVDAEFDPVTDAAALDEATARCSATRW